MDLFGDYIDKTGFERASLAARMRPRRIEDIRGQEDILGEGKLLPRLIASKRLFSAIFYGPPGSGKTSMASLIGSQSEFYFARLSAVTSNTARVKQIIAEARNRLAAGGNSTVIFVDEFHRFNRSQQEILLPHIEEGLIGFIGLTTSNPFHSMAPALLSRSHLFEFHALSEEAIILILNRALKDRENGLGQTPVRLQGSPLKVLARLSGGDARRALNNLELAVLTAPPGQAGEVIISPEIISETVRKKVCAYDRDQDQHYDTISAFIKSIRGSDPDAAVYWLARMVRGGEDPRFIARRLVILASEDIGNADPRALEIAVSAFQAVEYVGLPECGLNLAQAVTYLASAPKSNASYLAYRRALKEVDEKPLQKVPEYLRGDFRSSRTEPDARPRYLYPHDYPRGWVEQDYLEEKRSFYRPLNRGYERMIRKMLTYMKRGQKGNEKKDPEEDTE